MKKRILIIDDDYNGAKEIKEVLGENGFEAVCAYNSEEGFARLKESFFDLILLDLVLPDASGFKIAQKIKENPGYRKIPIIAISLKRENIDKHIASKVGIIDYLEKPLEPAKLLFRIKDILNIK